MVRDERQIDRRVKAAAFRELKPLDEFDLVLQPVDPEEADLRPGHLPVRPRGPRRAVAGTAGRGQEFLGAGHRLPGDQAGLRRCSTARSSTWSATSCTTRRSAARTRCWPGISSPTCLIVDDMGMKQLPKRAGEYLFEIIMRRYETRSTMMTSNRPLEDWGKLIGDVPSATAILDRFLHHAEIITITGKSYRLRNQAADAASSRRRQNQPMRRFRPPAPTTRRRSTGNVLSPPNGAAPQSDFPENPKQRQNRSSRTAR